MDNSILFEVMKFRNEGFYCTVCKRIITVTMDKVDEHVYSSEHATSLEERYLEPFTSFVLKGPRLAECSCCKLQFESQETVKRHRQSAIHYFNVMKMEPRKPIKEQQIKEQKQQISQEVQKQFDFQNETKADRNKEISEAELVKKNKKKSRKQEAEEEEFQNDEKAITLSFYNMEGLSSETLAKYKQITKRFLNFLEDKGLPLIRESLRKLNITNFLGTTKGQAQKEAALHSLVKGNGVDLTWSSYDYNKIQKEKKVHHAFEDKRIKNIKQFNLN